MLTDIKSRLTDWIASGGSWDDPYIKQQVRYAKRVAERMEEIKNDKYRKSNGNMETRRD